MKSNMLSKRVYFTISCIMLLVIFMFQFSSVIRKKYNNYDENIYAAENEISLTSDSAFTVETAPLKVLSDSRHFAVYIGNTSDSAAGSIVLQWCGYTKRNLITYDNITQYISYTRRTPDAVLIDSSYLNLDRDISYLNKLTESGINLVFCTLPDFTAISGNTELQNLLGISATVMPLLKASGYKLFGGFLLGGETWYMSNTEEGEAYQDFTLTLPWYVTGNATKTYMSAVLDSSVYGTVKNEDLPPVLWRKSHEHSYVFCVNGDYIKDSAGLGILNAIMYELYDYSVYPVINSEAVAVVNFPVFAFENESAVKEYYSRNTSSLLENIIWPDLSNLSEATGKKFTFFLTPQFDYTDGLEPSSSEMEYFFRLFREKGFEAGLSSYRSNSTSIQDKFTADAKFFNTFLKHYRFLSVYVNTSEVQKLLDTDSVLTNDIRTVVTGYSKNNYSAIFSYRDKNILEMKMVSDGSDYSYKNNFRVKSLHTALAYSFTEIDCSKLYDPDENSLLWDKTYRKISTALTSYTTKHHAFKNCTVTEADRQIRKFLADDYTYERAGNVVTVNVTPDTGSVSLMLRLHNENIADISGGSYTLLEENSYLIETDGSSTITITLK